MSNKIEPRTLPGFMELSPRDQVLFNNMVEIIKNTYEKYSFWPLDTPIIELSSVLLAKAGGETEKQIYRFKKGDNDISLRFDLTVPLAKYVASRQNELVFPFKRYQIGKVYRGERPQKGRFREFYQCDIDVIGNEELSLYYDAEIPAIINDIFKKLNIGDFIIKINNRKILNGFFSSLKINNYSDVLRIIDKIDKIGLENVKEELNKINISNINIDVILNFISINGSNDEILKKLECLNIDNETFNNGLKELKVIVNNLRLMKVNDSNFQIDLSIARGLDYYTGTVYETILKDYPQIGSICSGGRYDNLAEYYTDKKLPGVGISIGLTRLFYQLKEINVISDNNNSLSDIVLVSYDDNCYDYTLSLAQELRNDSIKTDVIYLNKFKSKLKYANNMKVKYIAIIGEDEIKSNMVTVKNMISGEQKTIKKEELKNIINSNLI